MCQVFSFNFSVLLDLLAVFTKCQLLNVNTSSATGLALLVVAKHLGSPLTSFGEPIFFTNVRLTEFLVSYSASFLRRKCLIVLLMIGFLRAPFLKQPVFNLYIDGPRDDGVGNVISTVETALNSKYDRASATKWIGFWTWIGFSHYNCTNSHPGVKNGSA